MIQNELLIILIALLILSLQEILKFDKKRYVNLFFILFLICGISFAFHQFFPQNIGALLEYIGSFWVYVAFSFVLLHSSLVLGNKKTSVLFSISLSFGLFFELIGVKYGWIFGNYYYAGTPDIFGLVPLVTVFSWAILIYTSYTISNIFLKGFKGEKPSLPPSSLISYTSMIILLCSISGLIIVNLDMLIDPVVTSPQIAGWVWIGGGPYFGIPLSNYLGWFFVAFLATLLFRLYESFFPKPEFNKKLNYTDLYIVILYFIYFLIYAALSILILHFEYLLIGVTTTLPFILIILLIYLNSRNNS
ncbi:MAG: carotenoid biosynthesis protein [Methanobacterium sp.]